MQQITASHGSQTSLWCTVVLQPTSSEGGKLSGCPTLCNCRGHVCFLNYTRSVIILPLFWKSLFKTNPRLKTPRLACRFHCTCASCYSAIWLGIFSSWGVSTAMISLYSWKHWEIPDQLQLAFSCFPPQNYSLVCRATTRTNWDSIKQKGGLEIFPIFPFSLNSTEKAENSKYVIRV